MLMRERLAVARSRSDYSTVAAAAFGDPLGNLLLRGLDNDDLDCLLRAKKMLADMLCRRNAILITRANAMAVTVLRYLKDSRCPHCEGRQFIRQESIVRACGACDGRGLVGMPLDWNKTQLRVLCHAQSAIGRALATARESLRGGLGPVDI